MKCNVFIIVCSLFFVTIQASDLSYHILPGKLSACTESVLIVTQQVLVQHAAQTTPKGTSIQTLNFTQTTFPTQAFTMPTNSSYMARPYIPQSCAALCCLKVLCCFNVRKREKLAQAWDTEVCCRPSTDTEENLNDC